ncbi:MAG: hypothetical protein KDK41_14100, partial [Leptospiraceae bacterium]|nr:hypothetical protein [Leptospiraceae bacterium]
QAETEKALEPEERDKVVASAPKTRVLIQSFYNRRKLPEYDYLKESIANAFAAEIEKTGKFVISPVKDRFNNSYLKDEFNPDEPNLGNYELLNEGEFLVRGYYSALENSLQIQVLVETHTGRSFLHENKVTTLDGNMFTAIDQLAASTAKRLAEAIKEPEKDHILEIEPKKTEKKGIESREKGKYQPESVFLGIGIETYQPLYSSPAVVEGDQNIPMSQLNTGFSVAAGSVWNGEVMGLPANFKIMVQAQFSSASGQAGINSTGIMLEDNVSMKAVSIGLNSAVGYQYQLESVNMLLHGFHIIPFIGVGIRYTNITMEGYGDLATAFHPTLPLGFRFGWQISQIYNTYFDTQNEFSSIAGAPVFANIAMRAGMGMRF